MNPYSIFGVGIAENMDDTQTLMNGFMRMAVDNAALSGNLLIEVDETNLVPGQDLSVYPGKVFRRQGGAPGQAIFGTKFPNVSNENMQMFDKARVLADESTGFLLSLMVKQAYKEWVVLLLVFPCLCLLPTVASGL